ncbi:Uncharacterised protein [Legionella lansingensis]|uniref:Uncharacterized protein n=1 Tax=Legionella lansingensis TaxID=45067 RepID=A0A0W0VGJ4_9GAMM|nr:hypothetical protein [Legionella lansingensis]KTD19285.1 hypothetical protein Llan_2137 [Legionella lansingensis]SNV50508.1 Uncharacterised protein [Legionella lansingensis]
MFSKITVTKDNNRFFLTENSAFSSRRSKQLDQMKGMLNSERIKFLFSDYGVELLFQEGNIRVSNLHSNHIMRTCAVVNFSDFLPNWLQEAHNKILKGGSIGQTIKEDGFKLIKENIFIGTSELPKAARERMEISTSSGAVHVYQLFVENPETSDKVLYCTITEAHSPHYLSIEDLVYLSPSDVKEFSSNQIDAKKYLDALNEIDGLIPQKRMEFQ